MNEIKIGSPIVLHDHCPVKWDLLKPLADNLIKTTEINSELEQGSAISTVANHKQTNPYQWKEIDYFKEWLSPRLDEAVQKFQLTVESSLIVTGCWINRHLKSGKTAMHTHRNVELVVVWYLEVPEGSGNLIIKDPLEYHWGSFLSRPRDHEELAGGQIIPVKTGDVLIFPGWVNHCTEENSTDNPRYVMSVNFCTERLFK
jgi:uncharacterized protein (TIGR02466 family)